MSDIDSFIVASCEIIASLQEKIRSFKIFEKLVQDFADGELSEEEKKSFVELVTDYEIHPWGEDSHRNDPVFEKNNDSKLLKDYVNILYNIVDKRAGKYL